jgi:hypothetical protein
MTLEGGEVEEPREPRTPLYQTSDSLFGSAICSRAMLRANRMPNKSHAEFSEAHLICFSGFAGAYLLIVATAPRSECLLVYYLNDYFITA